MSERSALASGPLPLRLRGRRLVALLSVLAVLATAGVTGSAPTPAWAADYPSWGDVVEARKNVKATEAKVAQIKALLQSLQAEVERTQEESRIKGELFQAAEQKYFEAQFKAEQLQAQADEAALRAEESTRRAGQIAAQLQRAGSTDVPMTLFFDGDNADNLLSNIGRANLAREQSATIYEQATQDRNTAQALTDQADVAKAILEQLKLEAEAAFEVAQAAAQKAQVALAESQAHRAELEAQLAALTTDLRATEADFAKGEAARQAAAEAAAKPYVSSSGWARPSSGWISSGYGNRLDPQYGYIRFHAGVDLASGCNTPIYAAQSGTVTYAGLYGTYGNFVLIDHGGMKTGYAHIATGGILVSHGQAVTSGQVIARVGATGRATGCHLHFEVRDGGGVINPITFMQSVGVTLG